MVSKNITLYSILFTNQVLKTKEHDLRYLHNLITEVILYFSLIH